MAVPASLPIASKIPGIGCIEWRCAGFLSGLRKSNHQNLRNGHGALLSGVSRTARSSGQFLPVSSPHDPFGLLCLLIGFRTSNGRLIGLCVARVVVVA